MVSSTRARDSYWISPKNSITGRWVASKQRRQDVKQIPLEFIHQAFFFNKTFFFLIFFPFGFVQEIYSVKNIQVGTRP